MDVDKLDNRHCAHEVEDNLRVVAEVLDNLVVGDELHRLFRPAERGEFGVLREEVLEIFEVFADDYARAAEHVQNPESHAQ